MKVAHKHYARRETMELKKRKPKRKMSLYILLAAACSILAVWTLIRFIENLGSSYQMLG